MLSIPPVDRLAGNAGAAYAVFTSRPPYWAVALFVALLAAAAAYDLKKRVIPDILSALIALVGLSLRLINFDPYPLSLSAHEFLLALLGGITGGGVLLLVALIGAKILRAPAMGGGDIKLMAACCTWLSLPCVALCLLLSALLGGLVAGVMMIARKATLKSELPFGVMIAAGAALSFSFGEAVINWYFRLLYFL